MELTPQEFDDRFKATLDAMVENLADNPEIDLKKFYGLTCFLENLAFFSPVLFGLLKESSSTKK